MASICTVNRNFAAVKFKCAKATQPKHVGRYATRTHTNIFANMLIEMIYFFSLLPFRLLKCCFRFIYIFWHASNVYGRLNHVREHNYIHCVYEGFIVSMTSSFRVLNTIDVNIWQIFWFLLIHISMYTWEMRFYICKHCAFVFQIRSQSWKEICLYGGK